MRREFQNISITITLRTDEPRNGETERANLSVCGYKNNNIKIPHSAVVEKENIMQRTVKGIKVNLGKFAIVDGKPTLIGEKTVTFANTTEENAIKKAVKKNIGFGVISTEKIETLYVLDDEIFFKYAKPVEPKNETTETAEEATTETAEEATNENA